MGIGEEACQVQVGSTTGAVVTSQKEAALLRGQAFTQSQVFTFSAGQVKDFIISPQSYVPGPTQLEGRIFFEIPIMSAIDGPVLVEFYDSPVITTQGTSLALPLFNRDSQSSISAQLIITQDPVLSSTGDPLSQLLIASSVTRFSTSSASVGASPLAYGLNNNADLLFRITNDGGNDNQVSIRHYWYEI